MSPRKKLTIAKVAYQKDVLGKNTDEIAKIEGVHPETVRRTIRSSEYKAYTGRYMQFIDEAVQLAHKVVIKRMLEALEGGSKEGDRAAREIYNNIVSKTIGGDIKKEEAVEEELTDAEIEELRKELAADNG